MNPSKSVVCLADNDANDRYFIRQSLLAADPAVTIVEFDRSQIAQALKVCFLDTAMN